MFRVLGATKEVFRRSDGTAFKEGYRNNCHADRVTKTPNTNPTRVLYMYNALYRDFGLISY